MQTKYKTFFEKKKKSMFVVIFSSISISWTLSLFIQVLVVIASLSDFAFVVITSEILLKGKSGNKKHKNIVTFMNLKFLSTFVVIILTRVLFEKMGRTYSILLIDLVFIVGCVGELQILISFGIGMGSTLIPIFVAASCPPKIRGIIIKK